MKIFKHTLFIIIIASAFSCQNANQRQNGNQVSTSDDAVTDDNRPKEELVFLNRVKADNDYSVTSDAIKKDAHIAAFNKYATDSLKKISNWEMIVTEINDNEFEANTFAAKFLDINNIPVYNLKLVAPIKIDHTVDTIAIDNRVDFTYTIPKAPKGANLKRQLNIIKTLSKGDTIIVSGSITHLDDELKVNFAKFYDNSPDWDVDLLITDVRKKANKK